MTLRAFTEEGIFQFEKYILQLRKGEQVALPVDLLSGPYTILIDSNISVDPESLPQDKFEAAKYLYNLLRPIPAATVKENSRGLWTWLSAVHFEVIRPSKSNSAPNAPYQYVYEKNWQRRYRHLLAFPHELYSLYIGEDSNNEHVRIFLNGSVRVLGGIIEQLASRQEIVTSHQVVRALAALYWDSDREAPKTGITTDDRDRAKRKRKAKVPTKQRKPKRKFPGAGGIVRFVKVFWQLHLTYDFYSLTSDQILKLLPHEFDAYHKRPDDKST